MNGEPLPVVHGGPVRLVVPAWAGNNWTKWVRRIVVARDESPGFFMQTGYRMTPPPVATGTATQSAKPQPVTWMTVKSLITWPRADQVLNAGPVEVRGIAWTGRGHVSKVEVSLDGGGRWIEAALRDEPEQGGWRQWRLTWDPPGRGHHRMAARATDSMGQVQPETPAWNKSGYLWNGIESVDCEIR